MLSDDYTLTNLAEHLQVFSHDTINRYLRGEKLTPRLLWDNVEHHIQVDEDGSIILMILLLIKLLKLYRTGSPTI